MKTIWKARIRPNSEFGTTWKIKIPCPDGSKAISVALQDGEPTVWFEVNPDAANGIMILYSVGTGFGEIPKGCRFIGTVIENEFVWHIYAEN
jgi:hypothetical protein